MKLLKTIMAAALLTWAVSCTAMTMNEGDETLNDVKAKWGITADFSQVTLTGRQLEDLLVLDTSLGKDDKTKNTKAFLKSLAIEADKRLKGKLIDGVKAKMGLTLHIAGFNPSNADNSKVMKRILPEELTKLYELNDPRLEEVEKAVRLGVGSVNDKGKTLQEIFTEASKLSGQLQINYLNTQLTKTFGKTKDQAFEEKMQRRLNKQKGGQIYNKLSGLDENADPKKIAEFRKNLKAYKAVVLKPEEKKIVDFVKKDLFGLLSGLGVTGETKIDHTNLKTVLNEVDAKVGEIFALRGDVADLQFEVKELKEQLSKKGGSIGNVSLQLEENIAILTKENQQLKALTGGHLGGGSGGGGSSTSSITMKLSDYKKTYGIRSGADVSEAQGDSDSNSRGITVIDD